MMIDSLGIFVVTVDSVGTAGFLIGYFLRKLLKLVLFAICGVLSFLLYLQYQGLITMNMDKIQSIADKFVTTIQVHFCHLANRRPIQYCSIQIGDLAIPFTGSMAVGSLNFGILNKVLRKYRS